ncbi:MAG TPA: SusC/RagA family TonB-linked outer membrane protein [Porphyromonadaceae bacterium]|jgi:iron complex outermembrane receptor protein|nr:SusC/RagA family TonB-linked outer membrane protein [Porphyromonadaceae bacterium]HBU45517.1 SusC/RagA family TonB-linked outer membrane protein [Porphyromonadaceae bacterium]HCB88531.1 SusC/RagA family TonB-linked outer membrane protein [Porphyromonadaceae bacterium]
MKGKTTGFWKGILSLFLWIASLGIFAQNITVRGTVTDSEGEPLAGVTVLIQGTASGTVTNVDGNFVLESVSPNITLDVSYVGMQTQIIPVNGRTTINVVLMDETELLDELVVVGYGEQRRREITGSVTNVTAGSFNQGVTRDAADLLQGKVAGLQITTPSGDVTQSARIRLRGVSTLQNDQGPFIVIDGVPGGDLQTVAPQDIESISVLKDASSAAIYGSRSAGGVILITTKRGSGLKPRISYDGYVAVSSIANKPDLLTADEWRSYARESGSDASVYDKYGASTDWFDEITREGISQNHGLSLSGGGSSNNYRASFNYLQREGVVNDNDMERFNFRFQIQQRAINDRLRVGLTGAATMRDFKEPNRRNFVLAYNMLPVYPVKLTNGEWFDTREYDQGNPVRNQAYNEDLKKNVHYYGSGDILFNIVEGLDIKTMLYKERQTEERSQYLNSETEAGRNDGGYALRENRIWDKNLMEWLLEYRSSFGSTGQHSLNAIAGYSWEENEYSFMKSANRNFTTDLLGANNLESGQGLRPNDVGSARNMSRLISFFGRAHYGYQSKYMITATLRRDGSSKFGANHKWGTFPSVSAAWGISEEAFMDNMSWINDMKIRVGYGITGNQAGLDPYKTLQLYGTSGTYYDNGAWLTAYKISQNANPDLKWEETGMFNVGLDFYLFNERVSGTLEWYDKRTTDMLYTYRVPTPPYLHPDMMANVGDMRNTGVELALNIDAVRTRNFNWNTSITLAHNKNEVTRLSNDVYTTSRIMVGDAWVRGGSGRTTHVIEEGYPVGQFYGPEFVRIDENGKYVFRNKEGEEVNSVTAEDYTYIGSAQPDLTFGWNNQFAYKNWDLSFFFRGTVGNDVLNMGRMTYGHPGYLIGANALNDPLVHQLKVVPEYSSLYVEDASHIRLDNMALGYTFNTKGIDWLERARIYATGQNLFVLTGYKGLDPEVDENRNNGLAPGVEDREYYPKSRTFSVGINLTF